MEVFAVWLIPVVPTYKKALRDVAYDFSFTFPAARCLVHLYWNTCKLTDEATT